VLLLLARPAELLAGGARARFAEALSDNDRQHIARFRLARDREVAMASRVLQRIALSAATDNEVAPGSWRFAAGANDRPVLVEPPRKWSTLRFSAANTVGLVGCLVAIDREVGFDLERVREQLPTELLDHCLSERERAALLTLASRDRITRFVELWTAKEAYLKARGLGVAERLAEVEILFDGDGISTLALGAALHDRPVRWQLEISRPTIEHVAAVCVERHEAEGQIAINLRWETQASDEACLVRGG
jgi:4'-phosphopantetheinyl transferase